ncbi:MAG: hypothetical protein H6699_07835 [Myxococcales bacterium]|nr:hypothetical protein [Myxococcales bacterium]
MTGNPLRWVLALALLALPACDEAAPEEDAGAGDTSADIEGDGGTDADASEVEEVTPDVPTELGEPDADAGELDGDDGGDSTDEADGDDGTADEVCTSNSDCPALTDCVEGECRTRCVRSTECDDLNPCTADTCVASHCYAEVIDPAPVLGDTTAGDCRQEACVDGRPQTVPAETDIPFDDGIYCTVEGCSGIFAKHSPDDRLCDDGDAANGIEVCSVPDGGCVLGDVASCEPLLPGWGAREICDNGQDDNNNGLADEGCPCEFGSVQRCFTGPPTSRTVGGCVDGYQQCTNRSAPAWADCEGEILPQEEICDAKDNDCNGCVDDLADCDPLLACPTEDFARPLRNYPLNASSILDLERGTSIDSVTWRIIAPANSATTGVEDPDAIETQVYLDVSGDYQISLQLDTDKGLFGCSWVVHAAGSGLRVEMRWDTFGSVDMDLHVHRSGTTTPWCHSVDDCHYSNCATGGFGGGASWGYPDSPASECETAPCHNPRLDIDNIRGFDPENINIDNPNDGDVFRVMAHKFSGSALTNPVMSFYCGGRLRAVFGEAPDQARLTNASSSCQGDTWRVADLRMIVDPDTGFTDCAVLPLTGSGTAGYDIRLNSSAF